MQKFIKLIGYITFNAVFIIYTYIIAGSISLIAAVLAVLSSKGKKLHIPCQVELTSGEWL